MMGQVITITIGVIVIFTIIFTVVGISGANKANSLCTNLKYNHNLDVVQYSFYGKQAIGLSFSDKKILIHGGGFEQKFSFDQIAAVEVKEDGHTVTKTDRGSQLLGIAVGGIALGGAGAIVGGLSGSKRSMSHTNSIVLHLAIDDRSHPHTAITYFDWPANMNQLPPAGSIAQARSEAAVMEAHIINAMRATQKEALSIPTSLPSTVDTTHLPTSSIDKVQKLWDMKQAGILTETEFAAEKTKILSGLTV